MNIPHYYLSLKDESPFCCEDCGGVISEYLEVEYLERNKWLCVWRLGCALFGPYYGTTEEALEFLHDKVLKHFKTIDAGPYDLRKIEIEEIVNILREYLGE